MPKISYVQPDDSVTVVEVSSGLSVKDGAVNNLIPGISAECGGSCICATCHVYVASEWVDKIEPAWDQETDMLEEAENVQDNSRLSCQVFVSDELDGLVVHIPG